MCIEGEFVGKDEGRQKGNKAPDEVDDVGGRKIDAEQGIASIVEDARKAINNIVKKLTDG